MRRNKLVLSILSVGLGLIAGGCAAGPKAMRTSFTEYSEAYADSSNDQMLLNLARRANGQPAYFLQMGLINATFTFGASGVGSVGQTRTHASGGALAAAAALTDAMTLGGNATLSMGETPTFTYTPLSGQSFGTALFSPIDSRIFFNLYAQGFPVDILMRVAAHSVTVPMPQGTAIFENVIDPERPENYRNFLRVAATMRDLQKHRLLLVSEDQKGFMMATNWFRRLSVLWQDPAYRLETNEMSIMPAEGGSTNVGFALRTFEGILTSVSSESRVFDFFAEKQPDFLKMMPEEERRPVLRIRADEFKKKTTPPVAQIKFKGERYMIADYYHDDPETRPVEQEYWNREVFNLLNELYVQISLDPNKLPVQQLIQVR